MKALDSLIDLAREHQMSEKELDAQVRSFAYGNAHLANPAITRADIDCAVDTFMSEKGSE